MNVRFSIFMGEFNKVLQRFRSREGQRNIIRARVDSKSRSRAHPSRSRSNRSGYRDFDMNHGFPRDLHW